MAKGAMRTRTIWRQDHHGPWLEIITEPAGWWRRQWVRLVEGIELLGDIAGPVLSVVGWGLLIALAVYSVATGPHDSDSTDTPSATFSTWPPATFPTTTPTVPAPLR